MDIEELKIALKKMIIEECDKDIEVNDISDDEQLIGGGDLDLDSLDALQISMCVQKQYGVRIENGPAARKALRNVTSLAETILAATSADQTHLGDSQTLSDNSDMKP
ncbi:hypothetical protein NBRC116493_31820 [Aurantivibrio infirmus]